MNGTMKLPMARGRFLRIMGGPYKKCPAHVRGFTVQGVKMAEEIKAPCAVDVPVRDFSIPTRELVDDTLPQVVELILARKPVYIGCMGGIGRTGLMFALVAKAFGVEDPVAYVREQYIPHAVETHEQKKFVAGYAIPPEVTAAIKRAKFWSFFGWKKEMTDGE